MCGSTDRIAYTIKMPPSGTSRTRALAGRCIIMVDTLELFGVLITYNGAGNIHKTVTRIHIPMDKIALAYTQNRNLEHS